MKYLETKKTDPYYNLAFEEYVLKHCQDGDYLLLWQNDNTIVMGLHQNPYEEINLARAEELKVKIVRRITGGGTVYHDLGNLNYSYITDWKEGEDIAFGRFLQPVIEAFRKYGLHMEVKGRNDLLLDGKKVSGNAQALEGNRILQHGTLLIHSNLEFLSSVLNVSAEKFISKSVKSVRSRITNIQDYVEEPLDIEEVKQLLKESFGRHETFEEVELTPEEFVQIEKLAEEKYRTKAWNFSRAPKFAYKNKRRFPDGSVEVHLQITEGRIARCVINGDFLSLKSVRAVEEKLIGCLYDQKSIKEILSEIPLSMYFGSVTAEELAGCFFESKD